MEHGVPPVGLSPPAHRRFVFDDAAGLADAGAFATFEAGAAFLLAVFASAFGAAAFGAAALLAALAFSGAAAFGALAFRAAAFGAATFGALVFGAAAFGAAVLALAAGLARFGLVFFSGIISPTAWIALAPASITASVLAETASPIFSRTPFDFFLVAVGCLSRG
jgi:hypothetical protein